MKYLYYRSSIAHLTQFSIVKENFKTIWYKITTPEKFSEFKNAAYIFSGQNNDDIMWYILNSKKMAEQKQLKIDLNKDHNLMEETQELLNEYNQQLKKTKFLTKLESLKHSNDEIFWDYIINI